MNKKAIPHIIISRLPVYLRTLQRLHRQGQQTISSQALGEILGITAAQIRKDISQFGEFGKQGTGYNIPYLIEQLENILHLNTIWDVAVVGIGDLGHALARYQGFIDRGFRIAALFDNDPAKIGQKIQGLTIEDISHIPQRIPALGIKIAMLTVPAQAAQSIADMLVKAGVRGILNYAPIHLNLPEGVCIEHLDPAVGLQRMTYYIGAQDAPAPDEAST